jgi:hypothetical protein
MSDADEKVMREGIPALRIRAERERFLEEAAPPEPDR